VLIGVLVIRLETASDPEDPWEAVVGPDSRDSVLLDVLVAGLLLAPSFIALRVADRLARGEDQAPGDDTSR
jgi:hypothetical protein